MFPAQYPTRLRRSSASNVEIGQKTLSTSFAQRKKASERNFYDFCWTCQLNEFSWLHCSGWKFAAVNMHSPEVWQHRCMYNCHQWTLQRLKNNDLVHTLLSDLQTAEFLICWVIQCIHIRKTPEFKLDRGLVRSLHLQNFEWREKNHTISVFFRSNIILPDLCTPQSANEIKRGINNSQSFIAMNKRLIMNNEERKSLNGPANGNYCIQTLITPQSARWNKALRKCVQREMMNPKINVKTTAPLFRLWNALLRCCAQQSALVLLPSRIRDTKLLISHDTAIIGSR